jgi:hypothetical protein
MSSLFEKAEKSKHNRLLQGGWSCCCQNGLDSIGCASRSIHTRMTNDIFCFGCGIHYNLSTNLLNRKQGLMNCSRHTSYPRIVKKINQSTNTRNHDSGSVFQWKCCGATGLEASVLSKKRDGTSGYIWGCESGYHYGVPETIEIEVEELIHVKKEKKESDNFDIDLDDLDSDDDDYNEMKEDLERMKEEKELRERELNDRNKYHTVVKKIPRPSGWYAIELDSNLMKEIIKKEKNIPNNRKEKLLPHMLISAITGEECMELPEDNTNYCLWERLQSIVLIKDVINDIEDKKLILHLKRAVASHLSNRSRSNNKTTTTTIFEIVKIHRAYGRPYEEDSDEDASIERKITKKGEDDKQEKEEDGANKLAVPYPMEGNIWQIECETPKQASLLIEALWTGQIGKVIDYAAKYFLIYINSKEDERKRRKSGSGRGNRSSSSNEEGGGERISSSPSTRVVPLLVDPYMTSCFDMGAQVDMLVNVQEQEQEVLTQREKIEILVNEKKRKVQRPWWEVNPPTIIGAPRPIDHYYPVSGSCAYCGGPWTSKDGRRCRYHPSGKRTIIIAAASTAFRNYCSHSLHLQSPI